MESRSQVFVDIKTKEKDKALKILSNSYKNVLDIGETLRVYDEKDSENIVKILLENDVSVGEIKKNKVGLEEYYIELMSKKEEK